MNHLNVVLQVLKEHQLLTKYRKCEFWCRSATFLGHIIYSDGVEVDPRKMEALKNSPRTLTPTNIKSFVGLVGYYRMFVEGFVVILSLLTIFIQKCKKF